MIAALLWTGTMLLALGLGFALGGWWVSGRREGAALALPAEMINN